MNQVEKKPSQESLVVLAALQQAVSKELERKRKLGHYAVMWENHQVVYKGEDAPSSSHESVKTVQL